MRREVRHKDEFTRQEFFVCSCGDWQDHIVVEYDRSVFGPSDRPYDTLSFHVQMNHFLPWYKRAWRAILYVFAKDAKWYHWSETLVTKRDAKRMVEILTDYINSPHSGD